MWSHVDALAKCRAGIEHDRKIRRRGKRGDGKFAKRVRGLREEGEREFHRMSDSTPTSSRLTRAVLHVALLFLGLFAVTVLGSQSWPAASYNIGSDAASWAWRTANYDMGFDTDEYRAQSPSTYDFWLPQTKGVESDVFINASALHSRQRYTGSNSSQFVNALAVQGHFPWMGLKNQGFHCANQNQGPDWDCPRGVHGLKELVHSDYSSQISWSASFLQRTIPDPSIGGLYNIIISTYWWNDAGNMTASCGGKTTTHRWVEAQIRIGKARWSPFQQAWIDERVGSQTCWVPRVLSGPGWFGYSNVTATFLPETSQTVTGFDLDAFLRSALAHWSLPLDSHWILAGIEVGLEGFGNHDADLDISNVLIEAYMNDWMRADANFDHAVDWADYDYVRSLYATCPGPENPSNWRTYQWRADVISDVAENSDHSHCVNIADLDLVIAYVRLLTLASTSEQTL